VSTGFKSGGFFAAPPPNSFEPEKMTAFEAGVKNRFLDNRLQVNVEAFYWKYKDHQESTTGPTSAPGLYTLVVTNAGSAKSYGADLDIVFRPTPNDELTAKVQYNKSNYDSFSYSNPTAIFGPPVTACKVGPVQSDGNQSVDCSGFPLIKAPEWSGTVGYNHTFDLGASGKLNASADVQFASGSYLQQTFLPSSRQEAYAIGNFDLTYRSDGGRWVVSAFVHNIWNEKVFDFLFRAPLISPGNPLANPDGLFNGPVRPPRTYGGSVRINF
jgi:iron complex outermembrane receptor protein